MEGKPERPAYGDVGIGALIREVRKARQVSQLEIAREAGCSEQLVGHIERGFRAVTPAVRKALKDLLDLDLPAPSDFEAAVERLAEAYKAPNAA